MANLPEHEECTDSRVIVVMAYTLLSLLVLPLGFVLIAWTIPLQLRHLRAAVDRYEKIYWRLNVAGCIPVAYGAVISGLMMVDGVCGEPWKLSEWWPPILPVWYATDNHTVIVLLDLLTGLTAGLALICIARCFGYVDEIGVWNRSAWLAGNQNHEVRLRCDTVSKHEPSVVSSFSILDELKQSDSNGVKKKAESE